MSSQTTKTVYLVQSRCIDPNGTAGKWLTFATRGELTTIYEAIKEKDELCAWVASEGNKSASAANPLEQVIARLSRLLELKLETRIVKQTVIEEVVEEAEAQKIGFGK